MTAATVFAAPHNLEAEESLLGAMMLASDATTAGLAACNATEFYQPLHGFIFGAIAALTDRREPIDAVTVAEELQHSGHPLPDPTLLVALIANTPSTAHAPHYARIVAEHAARRRLLGLARELAEASRNGDDDRAQVIIDELAHRTPAADPLRLQRVNIADLLRFPHPPVEALLLKRTDGKCLLIPGTTTLVHAEPGAGKTWLAMAAGAEIIRDKGHVMYLDYEGTARTFAHRLRLLGVTPDEAEGIHYVDPGDASVREIARHALAAEPVLVVLDGLAAALAGAGLNEDVAADALGFMRHLCKPLTDAGTAVLMLDHVVKSKESRGRWGRGSGAKLGEVDLAYSLEVVKPFAVGVVGQSDMRIAKDRHGAVGPEGSLAATVAFVPFGDDHLHVVLEPQRVDLEPWNGPTQCMVAVLRLLQGGEALSQRSITDRLRASGESFRDRTIREAANRLANDPTSHVAVTSGPRNARIYQLTTASDRVPPRPGVGDE